MKYAVPRFMLVTIILLTVFTECTSQTNKPIFKNGKQVLNLEKAVGNYHITIKAKKDSEFRRPMFAIWMEDMNGKYLKTLYISHVMSTSTYYYKKGVKGKHIIRRPEGLPYWSHKRGIKASDGLMAPLHNNADIDAVTGATPTTDFIINSKTSVKDLKNVKILFEVNQSYNWNNYYSKDRFPDDKVYSGYGQNGQPSVVYATNINLDVISAKPYKLNSIGHGHHSGKDGKLYKDLSKLTTSLQIMQSIEVTIKKIKANEKN